MVTETRYYRGLFEDRDSDGERRETQVTTSDGTAFNDYRGLAGATLETRSFNGPVSAANELSSTVNEYVSSDTSTPQEDGDYQPQMQLITATETRTPETAGKEQVVRINYTYDDRGRAIAVNDRAWDNVTVGAAGSTGDLVDRTCTVTKYTEDPAKWILQTARNQTVYAGLCPSDLYSPTTTEADRRLSAVRYAYDNGDLSTSPTVGYVTETQVLDGARGDASSMAFQTASKTTYDRFGRATKQTDADGVSTHIAYTAAPGAPEGAYATTISETGPDPDGNGPGQALTSTTTFDPDRGLPVEVQGSDGAVTVAEYNEIGRLSKVWLPGQDADDTPSLSYYYGLFQTNSSGVVTSPNRIRTDTLLPNGQTSTAFEFFDGLARTVQTQTPTLRESDDTIGSIVSTTDYNGRGQVLRTRSDAFVADEPTNDMLAISSQYPIETSFTYDGAGRSTQTSTDYKGHADPVVVTTAYPGNTVKLNPGDGSVLSSTSTDARGRTISSVEYNGNTFTAPDIETTYAYTPAGELASMTDQAGNEWTYTYDLKGQLVESTDPDTGTTTNSYTAVGLPETTTDALGTEITTVYDKLGRATTLLDTTSAGDPITLAQWTFDSATGRADSSITYDQGLQVHSETITGYTDAGQVSGVETTIGDPDASGDAATAGGLIPQAMVGSYNTSFGYNPDGSLKWTDYENSDDLDIGLPQERVQVDYDSVGRPTSLAGSLGTYVPEAKWSVRGQLDQLALGNTYGNLFWQSFKYDSGTGRLLSSQVDRQTESYYDERTTYTYDTAGNLTSSTIDAADTNSGDAVHVETQCYRYDALVQLTDAWTLTAQNGWEAGDDLCSAAPNVGNLVADDSSYWNSWTFSQATGNRKAVTLRGHDGNEVVAVEDTYAYADSAHAHGVTSVTDEVTDGAATGVTDAGIESASGNYAYDAAGRMTQRRNQTLTWDTQGRLRTITAPAVGAQGGSEQTNLYTSSGTRFLRVVQSTDTTGNTGDPQVTLYLSDGTEVSTDDDGQSVEALRYYSFAGNSVAVRSGPNRSDVDTLLNDPHGTASYSLTNGDVDSDTTGVLSSRRTSPYGQIRSTNGTWTGDQGFIGGTIDADAGLMSIGARPYDTALGSFLTADPVVQATNSRQINGYVYGNNNPLTYVDASGMLAMKWTVGLIDHNAVPVQPPAPEPEPSVFERIGSAVGGGLSAAADFVEDNKAAITGIATGIVVTAGCTVATGGVGVVGCAVAGGMAGAAVENALDPTADHSFGGYAEAIAIGGATGLLGGGAGKVAGVIGKKALSGLGRKAESLAVRSAKSKSLAARSAADTSAAKSGCRSGTCGIPGKTCFVAGTLIRTEGGLRRIEDIQVGDKVWARNFETGEDELRRVDRTYVRHVESLLTLTVGGGTLTTTADHPFWVVGSGWKRAGDLVVGDTLATPEGVAVLQAREIEERSETVYNFRVPGDHNYYAVAGDTPILVHNANYSLSPRTESAGDLARYTESQATRDAFPHYEHMTNDELLGSINRAAEGEGIIVSRGGQILDGHHRWDELLRRIDDGSISPDTPIQIWGLE
ncbi:polymorphic toxin-type HINT domain-containing protein [Nocardioides bruguierae]|uniref:Polymorphic toxin-type HINT domain-containing protein n=1 Tax=Nocardioides bruguierae TaxID=2945102 RepID=A0A9X2IHG6_9ACTN|nr:polymorphic toxin-type HINT domain-containing protein [Nocardioides bruguierae]MCM0621775.1 polymorphic toxin-type HINT domain-containing protein [Nocardioides bruguierae]